LAALTEDGENKRKAIKELAWKYNEASNGECAKILNQFDPTGSTG
jgi:hypothetical protein